MSTLDIYDVIETMREEEDARKEAVLEDYKDFLMHSKWVDKEGATNAVCDDELMSEMLPGLVHFAAMHQKDPARVGWFFLAMLESEAYRIARYSIKDR